MSSILLIGLNHRTATIDLRERFVLDDCGLLADLRLFGEQAAALHEVVILSTCNRLEIYSAATDASRTGEAIASYLARTHDIALAELQRHLYIRHERAAATHLLRVASGLDSMILGEAQILGQVADAAAAAHTAGVSGPLLSQLFNRAVHCGKRARAETEIGSYTTSVGHAAAQLAAQRLGGLRQRHALVIGAGEMAELAAVALARQGAGAITCINRTQDRAERLAALVQGRALGWVNLSTALLDADVVVSATNAPHAVIDAPAVAQTISQRAGRGVLFLDLAVPRDVDAAVENLPGVTLYDIDHLRDTVDANLARRTAAIPQVEEIVAEETVAYLDWLSGRQVAPTLVELRRHVERLARAELERTLNRLSHLSTPTEPLDGRVGQELAHFTHRIIHRLLHEPTVRLKARAAEGSGAHYAHMLHDLFDLTPPSQPSAARVETDRSSDKGEAPHG